MGQNSPSSRSVFRVSQNAKFTLSMDTLALLFASSRSSLVKSRIDRSFNVAQRICFYFVGILVGKNSLQNWRLTVWDRAGCLHSRTGNLIEGIQTCDAFWILVQQTPQDANQPTEPCPLSSRSMPRTAEEGRDLSVSVNTFMGRLFMPSILAPPTSSVTPPANMIFLFVMRRSILITC